MRRHVWTRHHRIEAGKNISAARFRIVNRRVAAHGTRCAPSREARAAHDAPPQREVDATFESLGIREADALGEDGLAMYRMRNSVVYSCPGAAGQSLCMTSACVVRS